MSIIETVNRAKSAYYTSLRSDDLRSAYEDLDGLTDSNLTEKNLSAKRLYSALLKVKLATVDFMRGKPTSEALQKALALLSDAKNGLDAHAFDSAWVDRLTDGVRFVAEFFADVNLSLQTVLTGSGFQGTIREFTNLSQLLDEKKQNVNFAEWAELFPSYESTEFGSFRYFSVNEQIRRKLEGYRSDLSDAFRRSVTVDDSVFVKPIPEYNDFQYVSPLDLGRSTIRSQIAFIETPLTSEFDLLLNANEKCENGKARNIVRIDTQRYSLHTFCEKSGDYRIELGSAFQNQFASFLTAIALDTEIDILALYRLNDLSPFEKMSILMACADFCGFHFATQIVIMDTSGERELPSLYNKLKVEKPTLPSADGMYLSFPSYSDVCDALDEQKIKNRIDLDELREKGAFLGFVGFNRLLKNLADDKPLWQEEYIRTSESNQRISTQFLNGLQELSRLIPPDWKTKIVKRAVSDNIGYDYDVIRDVLDDKIEAILSDETLNIYDLCGKLVIYCLQADEDISVWDKNLSEEERENRIRLAVRICAFAMRVQYQNPAVEFDSSHGGDWGGQCCNCGQLIKFKTDCIDKPEWTRDAILHELYHALQFTVINSNLPLGWYKKTYHLSNERISSWRDNFDSYADIDAKGNRKNYRIQTVEVDARDFACFCLGDTTSP